MRAQKILEYYSLDQNHFINICYSMGLDNSSNKLLESGPIAIKSRKEVINSVVEYSKNIEVTFNYQRIEALFIEVHNEFLPQMDAFIKPICEAFSEEIKSPVKSISIECLLDKFLDRATIGVEQNKPIFTPGVANLAVLFA